MIWIYTLVSVFIVSLVAFIGIFSLSLNQKLIKKILLYFVSFAAGAIFGDVFIHLLPETVKKFGFNLNISIYCLLGIILFFIIEKVIHFKHRHDLRDNKKHTFAYMNLVGDGLHNFIDGIIISVSYLVDIKVGIATTVAVLLHEIPQEIGDFSVLIHGGFSKGKALFLNFVSGLFAIFGAIIGLLIGLKFDVTYFLIPFAAGGLIYIAGSNLIPELHRETNFMKSLLQVLMFIFGILVMVGLIRFG